MPLLTIHSQYCQFVDSMCRDSGFSRQINPWLKEVVLHGFMAVVVGFFVLFSP